MRNEIQTIANENVHKKNVPYGYLVVIAAFIFMVAAFGVNYNFGVFFDAIQDEFGWNRGTISGAYALLTVISGFLGIVAGRAADKKGPFIVAIVLTVFLGGGYILMSSVHSVASFYIYNALILSIGVGSGWPALIPEIGHYFHRNRGLMIGCAAAGIGVSSFLICPITSRLILSYGWRETYLSLGIAILIVLGVTSLIYKNARKHAFPKPEHPEDIKRSGKSFREALYDVNYYLICAIYFLFGYAMHTVMIHIIPYTLDMGYTGFAVKIVVLIGGISMLTRIGCAWFSDKVGVKWALMVQLVFMFAAFAVILLPLGFSGLILFGVLFGLSYGGAMVLSAIAVVDYFGKRSSGMLLGTITSLYTVGGALGPLVTGILFDLNGNYRLAFVICAVMSFLTLILCLRLTKARHRVVGCGSSLKKQISKQNI